MSYQQSEEAIVRNANQYIEANKEAIWYESPETIFGLKKLKLNDLSGIATFEPLKNFKELDVLFIGDRRSNAIDITSLNGISSANSLKSLTFACPVTIKEGIEEIGQLKQLNRLSLANVKHELPSDLLKSMRQLLSVCLSMENYKSIKTLPEGLIELNLNFNEIADFTNWNTVNSLQKISIGRSTCQLSTLDGLNSFPGIRHIEIYNAKKLSNIDKVTDLLRLRELEINLSAVTSLKALANHPALEVLKIRSTKIQTIQELAHCPRMRVLLADRSLLSTLEGIQKLPALQKLWVGETRIKDLSPLDGLTQLRDLDLSELFPDSWEVLSTLTGLEVLDLSHSSFNNTSLLFRLPDLKYVNLTGCAIDSASNSYQSFAQKLKENGGGVKGVAG